MSTSTSAELLAMVRKAWVATLPSRTDPPYRENFESALDILAERLEAAEREARRAEALTFAIKVGAADVSAEPLAAAEARVAELEQERDEALHAEDVAERYRENAEAEVAKLKEALATNSGSLNRVLAQEKRLCKTLDDLGRWLGHPAEPTELDIQQVIAEIENVRKGSPKGGEQA